MLNVYIALNESAVYLQFVGIGVVILFIDEGNFISRDLEEEDLRMACAGWWPTQSLTPPAFDGISRTHDVSSMYR